MLSDKTLKSQRSNKNSIKRKITIYILSIVILTYLILELLRANFLQLSRPFSTIASVIMFVSYAYIISRFIANLLSYKLTKQVNRMTNIAKAIANSNDLKKRMRISYHEDELSNLEQALNSMLSHLENSFERQKQFISDASHELRTPVSILKGYLDILDEWGKKDNKLLEESIQSMKEETYHMKKLIENLLFLARADQNQLLISYEHIELNHIIEKLIRDTKIIAENLRVNCEVNEVLVIEGDKELILQVLRALVENAIKYTEDNGEIIINSYKEKNFAVIDVIDNGIGISEKDTEMIFDKFYRVEEARNKDTGGSGLGLALVKKIVDMHNGKIDVRSKPHRGTKISIYIPLNGRSEG